MTNMSAVASAAVQQRRGWLRPYIVNGREVDVNHVTGVPRGPVMQRCQPRVLLPHLSFVLQRTCRAFFSLAPCVDGNPLHSRRD